MCKMLRFHISTMFSSFHFLWIGYIRDTHYVCCLQLNVIVIMSFRNSLGWFERPNTRYTSNKLVYDVNQRIPRMNCEMDEL